MSNYSRDSSTIGYRPGMKEDFDVHECPQNQTYYQNSLTQRESKYPEQKKMANITNEQRKPAVLSTKLLAYLLYIDRANTYIHTYIVYLPSYLHVVEYVCVYVLLCGIEYRQKKEKEE